MHVKPKSRNASRGVLCSRHFRSIVLATMAALLSAGKARGVLYDVVVLNPTGFSDCFESAIAGGQQGGYGFKSTANHYHAILWSGSGASAVDLNPSGFDYSVVNGISGTQQVGDGYGLNTDYYSHALSWSGSSSSVV